MDKPWHADDSFWLAVYPITFGPRAFARAEGEVDAALRLLDLPPGASILDIPCGPGRHSVPLARRGFRVTGVDRTRPLLDKARQHAAEAGVEVELLEGDLRTFRRPGAFDAVLNMFTSFGYFEDPAEDLEAARGFHRSLRPGGRLLMELVGKEVLARTFRARDWVREGGAVLIEERVVRDGWDWMTARWTVLNGSERHELTLEHRIYSATELLALLRAAGFGEVRAFGSLEGAPYDHDAKRLVVLATA
ncbi:MAG: class I SAM-dependent methyltransferase [Candidatus Sumerlaeia bacterium]|nr:class I SAM-dependent methyltransferase [Candidatus Sumerlaeia bacterium]